MTWWLPLAGALLYNRSLQRDDEERRLREEREEEDERHRKREKQLQEEIDDLKSKNTSLGDTSINIEEDIMTMYGVVGIGEWHLDSRKGQPCEYSFTYGHNYNFMPEIKISCSKVEPTFYSHDEAQEFIDTIKKRPEWFREIAEIDKIDLDTLRIVPVPYDHKYCRWEYIEINN